MQILVPLAMTFGLFGGEPMELVTTSGTLIGKIQQVVKLGSTMPVIFGYCS